MLTIQGNRCDDKKPDSLPPLLQMSEGIDIREQRSQCRLAEDCGGAYASGAKRRARSD